MMVPEGGLSIRGSSDRFASSEEISGPRQLLERLGALFRLGDLLEEAYQRRDVDQCVKLAREVRSTAESYARVAGWLNEGSSSTIIDQRRQLWVENISKLSDQELWELAGDPTEDASGVHLPRLTDGEPLTLKA
ncbi:MAG: hypothetical protein WB615_01085 [Candidatus Tumulicola sp.]